VQTLGVVLLLIMTLLLLASYYSMGRGTGMVGGIASATKKGFLRALLRALEGGQCNVLPETLQLGLGDGLTSHETAGGHTDEDATVIPLG
jgi:hypothetical protein